MSIDAPAMAVVIIVACYGTPLVAFYRAGVLREALQDFGVLSVVLLPWAALDVASLAWRNESVDEHLRDAFDREVLERGETDE